jgi:hypothetical protein
VRDEVVRVGTLKHHDPVSWPDSSTLAHARRAARGLGPAADEGELASFDGATGRLNFEAADASRAARQVVLVTFWTYTCISWLRQLPFLRAWAEKYSSHGLVMIGVHIPEFSFEYNADNVRQAIQDMKIT